MPATLMISDSHEQVLAEQGRSTPAPINGFALIDTGASRTCFDQAAAIAAGLPISDTGLMTSATQAEQEVPIFTGKIMIPQFGEIHVEQGMGAVLENQGLVALIGRDLLENAVLVYNGSAGFFSISI
ncbi:MAG: retroviral-like aspartic protease family protein [Gammaproteobacteria bacterium]|nr:retroviral-like aspartic protease family protein [Gammaproteobacteria bacterium]